MAQRPFESATGDRIGFEKLVSPGSILLGKSAEIDILLQLEPATGRRIGFENLVPPGSILLGQLVEIDTLLQLESQTVEFQKLSSR